MVGDPLEHVSEIGFRIQAIELGGTEKAIHGGSPLSAGIRAQEEEVFSSDANRSQRALGGIVVCAL